MGLKKNLTYLSIFILTILLTVPFAARAQTNFTYSTTCVNDSVRFIITDDISQIDSVKWYFVNPPMLREDSSSMIEGAAHLYAATGTYTVTLIAYRNGVADTNTQTIEIVAPVVYNMIDDLTICETSGPVTITVPDIPGATYTWYYLEDTVTGGTYTFQATEMATYKVAINGCLVPDSVNVFTSPVPTIDLGPDRNLCIGEEMTLDATAQNATYVWSTMETTPTIVPTASGTYSVIATVAGCGDYTDEVVINFTGAPYPFSLGPDTLLCPGESVILNAARPEAVAYQWNTGSPNPSIQVSNNGDYSVFVTVGTVNGLCDVLDTIGVRYSRLREFSLGNDTTICKGNFLVLTADHGTGNYLWQDGSDQATYYVDTPGYYNVRVQIGRCVEFDTIRVDYQDTLRVTLGEDSVLCFGETLMLTPRGAGTNYKWQDSTATATFLVTQPGIYAIVANNVCNRATDSVVIYYEDCNCTLFLPTAFSPNNDGLHDVFRPVFRCILGNYKLSIYNRWGELVFFTTDPRVGWNGTINGKDASISSYVWIVEYLDELNNKPYKKQGTVTLVR